MQVEFADVADLEPMAELLQELFTLESDFQPRRDRQLAALRWILAHPGHGRLFVLRNAGRVAGMANALISVSTAEGGPVLILEDLIIAADHRGCGHGRRLVEHVLRWAAVQGMSRVTLLADRDNEPALAFYARLGFTASAMRVLRQRL